jgi:NADH:ubiquinone oxidoreductase subunit 2 (subunit N)
MLINKPIIGIIYFSIYSSLVIPIFIIFYKYNILSSKHLRGTSILRPQIQFIIILLLLSLAGLPPLTGFAPKFLAIIILYQSNAPLIIILIIGSLINLFFYLNITINIIISEQNSANIVTNKYMPKNTIIILRSGILSLGITPLIMLYAMIILNKS